MSAEDFTRAFLGCYFSFVAIYYAAKLSGLAARAGVSYADPGQPGTTQFVAHRVFHVFRLAIWAVMVARVVAPGIDPALALLPGYGVAAVNLTGVAAMAAALFVSTYAHSYMDADWRSGVAPDGPARLITTGPFALTRNPMFIGVLLGQIGLFLALPSVFTLVCLVIGATVVMRQADYEEKALARAFGPAYEAYAQATPRWLPLLSRGRDATSVSRS